ncbi:MAG: transposase [Candidatus Angelobacter sp.]
MPIILVIPHTFGRRLNFHPHLHILVSAGGLNNRENRWVHFRHIDKYALMHWWRFAVVQYLAEVLESEVEDVSALDRVLNRQGKRPWNIHIKAFLLKMALPAICRALPPSSAHRRAPDYQHDR